MTYLYIFIGGGLGSVARFLIGKLSSTIVQTSFPLGTFLSNMVACIILALIVLSIDGRTQQDGWLQPLILIGFCGGFSTFSTFSNETFELMDTGNYVYAISNVLISVFLGIGLIYLIRTR